MNDLRKELKIVPKDPSRTNWVSAKVLGINRVVSNSKTGNAARHRKETKDIMSTGSRYDLFQMVST